MVLYQILNSNKIKILHAKEIECPQQDEMIAIAADHIYERMCNYSNIKIYVDGSNPGFIRALKDVIGDIVDYGMQIDCSTEAKEKKRRAYSRLFDECHYD
jgi:hypothetical protein